MNAPSVRVLSASALGSKITTVPPPPLHMPVVLVWARKSMHTLRALLAPLLTLAILVQGCGDDTSPDGDFEWDLPSGFPEPRVPEDNPMSDAKVELGRHLFYDVRLSENETQSCGSCHEQRLAFTDGLARSIGSTGEEHPRSSMSLANVAFQGSLAWANPLLRDLEEQALIPMFGEEPVELGLAGKEDELLARLAADADYEARFAESFPDEPEPLSIANVVRALSAFQRTIISADAPYDRFTLGDQSALTESEQRGFNLFFSERLECFHCHGGFNLSSSVDHAGSVFDEAQFHNNGLYNVDGRGAYPARDNGVFDISGTRSDQGKFKPPTLRNIALTAPYMHDGSIATLEEVLDHYAAGGRNVTEGDDFGDGRESPLKSEFVSGFELSEQEREDVLAFLRSLTDETFLNDPRYADPFE